MCRSSAWCGRMERGDRGPGNIGRVLARVVVAWNDFSAVRIWRGPGWSRGKLRHPPSTTTALGSHVPRVYHDAASARYDCCHLSFMYASCKAHTQGEISQSEESIMTRCELSSNVSVPLATRSSQRRAVWLRPLLNLAICPRNSLSLAM